MNVRNLVRVGAGRLAPRGSSVLLLGLALLMTGAHQPPRNAPPEITTAGAVPSAAETLPASALLQQDTLLTAFLARVRGLDATICGLVARALHNRWGRWYGGFEGDAQYDTEDQRLIAWLDSVDIAVRHVSTLRPALADGDPCIRQTAAQLLGRARTPNLSVELQGELSSTVAGTRQAALLALGFSGQATGFEAARAALRDVDSSVRVTAAWALGVIKHPDAIVPLTQALQSDGEPRVRRAAAAALGRISG